MKFAVENFKIFKERQEFDIRPITILVGPNGSGKSSVIRAIEMMGSFKKILPYKERLDNVFFERFQTIDLSFAGLDSSTGEQSSKTTTDKKTINLEFSGFTRMPKYNYALKLKYRRTESNELVGKLYKVEVYVNNDLSPVFEVQEIKGKYYHFYNLKELKKLIDYFSKDTNGFVEINHDIWPGLDGQELIEELNSDTSIIASIENAICNLDKIEYKTTDLQLSKLDFNSLVEQIIASQNLTRFSHISFKLKNNKENIVAKASDFLAHIFIDFVWQIRDFQYFYILGTNRSLKKSFLNLSADGSRLSELEKLVIIYFQLCDLDQKRVIDRLKGSLKNFTFCDDVKIVRQLKTNTAFVEVKKKGRWLNLESEGYGVVSLFSVLFTIAFCTYGIKNGLHELELQGEYQDVDGNSMPTSFASHIIAIEEPEMNLHPSAQSKLAEILANNNGENNIHKLLIETHSEYLIRKLQYLVAKGELKPDRVQIYYFNDDLNVQKGMEKVYGININEDGSLTRDFGPGFFDEADSIALDLFLLKQSQKN